jgi:hypothetical protein
MRARVMDWRIDQNYRCVMVKHPITSRKEIGTVNLFDPLTERVIASSKWVNTHKSDSGFVDTLTSSPAPLEPITCVASSL